MTVFQHDISLQLSPMEAILSVLETENLKQQVIRKSYKKNEAIYLPYNNADRILFVEKGRVKVVRYSDGRKEIIKSIVTEGEVFGLNCLLGKQQREDAAIALEATVTISISKEQLKSLMFLNPNLSFVIMKILGDYLSEMEHRLEGLVYYNSRSRVIDFLVQLVHKRGQRVGYELLVRKFFTHQDIANMTGTSRQTVTTVLNELRSKNILTFNRRRLLVRDLDLLRKEGQL